MLAGGSGEQRLRLGVVWWLVPNESYNEDGRYVQYLDAAHEGRFRPCDPELYDGLQQLVRHGPREVAAVREVGLLPDDAVFFERLLSYEDVPRDERLRVRDEWCTGARQATEGCDLVFLDPDNGLATTRMRRGSDDRSAWCAGPHVAAWTQRAFTSGSRFTRGDTLLARITPSLENGKTAFVDFLAHGETAWGSTEFIVLRPKPPWPPELAYVMTREPEFR